MTIGTRLTLWYSGLLLASLLVLCGGLYYELIIERNADLAAGRQREPVEHEIDEVLLYYAIPAVLVTLGGGWWLMRKALSPVRRLTAAAEGISARTLGDRLPRTGNGDELDRLTEVFNAMLGRLEASFAREREFTLHASHELKTPLTIMRGQVETALRDGSPTPSQGELLGDHLDEIQRLAAIVDSLSLLAQADAGLVEFRREPVRLDELVHDACADARLLGEAAGLTVVPGEVQTLSVMGDRRRLRQLLLALTDNALKYNHRGGIIRFTLLRSGDRAELSIVNTGPGIPADKLPRVFDRFYRCDPAHGSTVEGSGLGLSIAQWIVTSHGGDIRLASRMGEDTTVTVQLPGE